MDKDDLIFIEHLLDAINKIEKYIGDISVHEFVDNELIQDAVIRNFEIIGEATKHLSENFRNKHTEVPWKKIAGMRDILIHDYLGIDIYSVWETIEKDLPELKNQLNTIVKDSK